MGKKCRVEHCPFPKVLFSHFPSESEDVKRFTQAGGIHEINRFDGAILPEEGGKTKFLSNALADRPYFVFHAIFAEM